MREEYRAELAEVTQTLVAMAEGVRTAMRRATVALFAADQTEAEEVVRGDLEIDARYHLVEEKVYDLLARQAPVASDLRLVVTAMHTAADRISGKVVDVLRTSDAQRAAELERDDDEIDELQRQLFGLMLGTAWRHGVEPAVDGALLGRWYERFADHAVNAGRAVVYFVTGKATAGR